MPNVQGFLFLFCKLHVDYVTGNEKGAGKWGNTKRKEGDERKVRNIRSI